MIELLHKAYRALLVLSHEYKDERYQDVIKALEREIAAAKVPMDAHRGINGSGRQQ